MSHYWYIEGKFNLSRPLTPEEMEVTEDFTEDFDYLTVGKSSIETTTSINHFPHVIEHIDSLFVHNFGISLSGSGTYTAEDGMSGEWSMKEGKFDYEDYERIVHNLRFEIAKLQEGK